MSTGEGKGWAKGRTAATDQRIARAAAAHRGMTYGHHLQPQSDRRYTGGGLSGLRTLPLGWSAAMAYVVGLTATDGCLLSRQPKINFKSEDRDLVVTYLAQLGCPPRVRTARTRLGRDVYFAEFSDRPFYEWLQTIGLMPRKSLILGAISAPDEFFFPLLRGLFEGDGTLTNFVHHPTPSTSPDYAYERLWLYFTSASRAHIDWVRTRTAALAGVCGYIEIRAPREGRRPFYRVKFGKSDAIELLRRMYPTEDVPKLERKWRIWRSYELRNLLNGAEGGI